MKRLEAVEHARKWGLRYGRIFTQGGGASYLPKTEEQAKEWLPHEWVIAAIQDNHNVERVSTTSNAQPPAPEDFNQLSYHQAATVALERFWDGTWDVKEVIRQMVRWERAGCLRAAEAVLDQTCIPEETGWIPTVIQHIQDRNAETE